MNKMYIGPSIEGVLQAGSTFSGGYPPRISSALKTAPYLADLMVDTGQIAQAKKELRDPESSLNMIYRRAEKGGHSNGI